MNKTIHFFGNSVFGQLISLIDSKFIIDVTSPYLQVKLKVIDNDILKKSIDTIISI